MLARINSVETATDKLPGLVEFCQDQLPAFRDAPGMRGFYLLADRQSGKIVTISLWDSADDLRKNDEARGIQVRKEATSELGIAATPVEIYEVLMQA
jgi:heme-degrading monooxygenase HmoA